MSVELAESVRELALEAGYVDCGIAPAERFTEYEEALDERVRLFPEAADLYEGMRARVDPFRQDGSVKGWRARSLVVCIRRYGKYSLPEGLVGHIGRHYLADGRCPGCPDYDMPQKMCEGLERLGLKGLAADVPQRLAAMKAGVARIGRNGFAYSDRYGSWINIATWLVDADLSPEEPSSDCPCPPGCEACARACPTGAIVKPYVMRMDRCVAYLTYRAPEPVAPELWERMGGWIYGCDRCQEVCPLNHDRWEAHEEAPWLQKAAAYLHLEALAAMDEATYREIVHPLFWYIPLENLDRWQANARRALGCAPGSPGPG